MPKLVRALGERATAPPDVVVPPTLRARATQPRVAVRAAIAPGRRSG